MLQAHYGIFFPRDVLWGTLNYKSYNILHKKVSRKAQRHEAIIRVLFIETGAPGELLEYR